MAKVAAAATADSRVLPDSWLLNPDSLQALVAPKAGSDMFPALILSGPEGSGKTSLAYAHACALNCVSRLEDGRGCGVCRQCRRFLSNQHPDLMVVAPETESQGIKVEQIRSLGERLQSRPFEARYRCVMLVKAEAMSETAANSLLKILEEPPSQTVFVLETVNHAQVLPTVRSRCRLFKLLPIEHDRLTAWLESQGHAGEAARLAARLAQGAPGRALRLLGEKTWWTRRSESLNVFARLTSGGLSAADCAELADGEAKRFAGPNWRDRMLEYLDVGATWLRDGMLLHELGGRAPLHNVDRRDDLAKAVQGARHPDAWRTGIGYALEARLQVEGNIGAKPVLALLFRQIRDSIEPV